MQYQQLHDKLQDIIVHYNSDLTLLEQRKTQLQQLKVDLETCSKSLAIVQQIAQQVQSQLSVKIDGIVNLGLQTCFPEYQFKLEYVSSRGKTEAHFNVYRDDQLIDLMNQNGGGVIDLVAFCLRVAIFTISDSASTIVLDEPFRFVSKALRPKVAELLSALSEKVHIQFIYVTHVEELADCASNKILIKKIQGVSQLC